MAKKLSRTAKISGIAAVLFIGAVAAITNADKPAPENGTAVFAPGQKAEDVGLKSISNTTGPDGNNIEVLEVAPG